jgi:hypothetical protein
MNTSRPLDRNPYLILGLPFGATRDEANRAYALKARGLRRTPGGEDALVELGWALNQIDEAIADPRKALEIYRIPADPGAFYPEATGILRPAPERLARREPESREARLSFDTIVADELLRTTLEVLGRIEPVAVP